MTETKKVEPWTFFIAALALVVSGLSWWDVHEQVRLARGQIRSYVQVVEMRLVEPISDASFITLQARIKNFGQTAAVNVYGEMDYAVGIPDPKGEGNQASRRTFGSMGPGLERTVILRSNRINRRNWPLPSIRGDRVAYFFGTIWFTDDTTHDERKDDWCYKLPLRTEVDLKRIELEAFDILSYKSK